MSGVNFDSIPDELKAIPSWVLWRLEPGKKRELEKHPYSITGKMASCSNPKTWSDFNSVVKEFKKGGYTGIGFQLSSDNEIVCIDLDDKENTGKLPGFLDIAREFNSFTEVSYSGLGLHIWCIGKKPGSKCRREYLEIYEQDRFIAVTGDQVDGSPNTINSAQEAINKFYELVSDVKPEIEETSPQIATEGGEDVSLPEVMRRCRTNPKFERLYNGDISGYPSASEAVLALSNIVSWASIRDPQMIDLIVRQSNLYTEDWERTKQYTIPKALKIVDVYEPRKKKKQQIDDETGLLVRDDTSLSISDLNLTDIGNGLRFQALYGDKFRFDFSKNTWYYWNGEIWLLDNNGCAKKAAQYTIAKMADEIKVLYKQGDEKHAELVFKHMKKSASERARNDMLKSACPHLAVSPGIWNSKPELLNLQNGTLNLETFKLQGFNQGNYLTFKAGVDYDPEAKCPQWIDHLNLVFGNDKELISAFQLMAGYSLLSGNPQQLFFIPYGSGKNGKSVTINTLRMIMGDYGVHIAPQSLMIQKNPDKARSDLVRIQYKRLVTSSEGEQGAKLDIGWIKQISGGEPIVARALYQNEIEFRVEAVIWFATNHKPIINEYNEAIWRRIWLIPFNQVIPEDKRIVDYERKLIESEGSGILNWMIEGLKRYYDAGGLIKPKAITDATQEYQEDEDPLGDYLKENTVITPGAKITDRELYTDYSNWCLNNGIKYCMSKNSFTRHLLDHQGITSGRTKSSRLYLGIRLKTDEDRKRESEEVTKDTLEGFV